MDKVILDPEDEERFKNYGIAISTKADGYKFATFTSGPYARKFVSRIIMNCPDDLEVDHRNKNSLDCRKENMRVATRQQQIFNRRKHRNTELPRGVKKSGKNYIARICINYTTYHLGTFSTIEAAKEAYEKKAKEWFGEFYSPDA